MPKSVKSQSAGKPGVGRPARDEQEFLDAALVVFARKGLDGSSMEDLAAAADSTKPTLYARFGSKNELYERVVRREADAFIANILASYEAATELSVHQMTEQTMVAWFTYLDEHPSVLELLFSPDRSHAAQEIADEVEDRIVEGLARNIESAMARANRRAPAQARFLAAMTFGATLHATRLNARTGILTLDHAVALAASWVEAANRGVEVGLLERPARRKPPARRRKHTERDD